MPNTSFRLIRKKPFQVFLMIFFLIVASSSLKSQNVSWAVGFGSSGSDQGYDISTDSSGNVYVTGWFSGTIQIGGQTLISNGQQDIFVACFNNTGTLNWLRQAGGPSNDVSASIVTTPSGESYITGWFSGTCDFDDSLVVSNGNLDMFVAKYDASGTIRWVRHGGGPLDDYGNRLALSLEGGVTLAGSFKDTLDADGLQLISLGNRDALLCRYASDGQLVWARGTGGSGEDRAYGIIQDADSNYFVTGLFTGIVDFGNTRLTCSSLFGTYVGKISGQGNFLWAVKGDGGANDFARGFGVVTDPAGNAVVNGFFSGVLRMGGFTLNATGGQYDQDGYILKFNTNGNVVWAKRTGGNGTDQGTDLHATSTGEIIEVGFFQDTARFANLSVVAAGLSDVFVAKYDSSGNVLWVEGYGGSGNEFGYGVTGDMLGNVFITGAFSGSSMFGNQALVSAGGNDIFMAGIADVSNSIPDNESSVSAFIYPNPSTGWFRFDCSSLAGTGKAIGIHIMDMAGKTTYHNENIDSQAMIDVSEIESGCYVVRFYNEDFSTCTRLVIGSR